MATPQIVNLINPSGQLVGVPAEEVGTALQSGYRQETDDEYAARWSQERYGEGAGNTIKAGALGAARGLTFGISDQLLKLTRTASPELLSTYKESNPVASTVGEIGGAVAPVLLSGGTGAIGEGARIAGIIPRAVAGLGRATESAVARRLGGMGLRGIGARLLEQGAAKAAAGAVEGTLYGAGQLVSEEALGNTDLTAERVLAHLGMSAVLGGAVGGALGAGGELATTGIKKAASVADEALRGRTLAEKAKNWLDEFASSSRMRAGFGQNKRAFVQMNRKALAEIDESIPSEKMLDAADRKVRQLIEGGAKTQREITEGLLAEREAARKATGELVTRLDDAGMPSGLSGKALAEQIREKVASKYKGSAAYQGAYERAVAEADKLEAMGDLTFRQSVRERQGQQAAANYEREMKNGGAADIHAKVARLINEAVDEKAAPVFEKLGLDKRAYAIARRNESLLEEMSKYAENRALGDQANRMVSLTDTGMGAAGVAGSLALGTAAPAAMLAGAAVGAINKAGRTYGPAYLSRAAQFVSDKLGAIKGTSDQVSNRVTSSIDSFVKSAQHLEPVQVAVPASAQVIDFPVARPPTRRVSKREDKSPEYRLRQIEDVRQLAADPAKMTERLASSINGFSEEAPRVAAHVAQQASAAVQFLAAKAPRDTTPPTLLNPMARKWQPSRDDLAKWSRYVAAVDDPLTILDELKSGTVSHEAVEAVQAVYPQLYEQIRTELAGRVAELQKELPYRHRVQLSILFGVPLDPTLQPQFVASAQSIFDSVAKQAAAAQARPASGGKSETAAALATTSERLLQG